VVYQLAIAVLVLDARAHTFLNNQAEECVGAKYKCIMYAIIFKHFIFYFFSICIRILRFPKGVFVFQVPSLKYWLHNNNNNNNKKK